MIYSTVSSVLQFGGVKKETCGGKGILRHRYRPKTNRPHHFGFVYAVFIPKLKTLKGGAITTLVTSDMIGCERLT